MKTIPHTSKLIALAGVSLLLAACSAAPAKPAGAEQVQNKLLQLQANPQLATRAPVALQEAQAAVLSAQELRTEDNMAQGDHLVYLADRKVEIANARAQTRFLEDQRKQLSEQREGARLDSRTLEADQLKRQIAELNAANAALQLKEMDMARRLAEQAQVDADLALARSQATKAKVVNDEMLKGTKSLKQEMQRTTGEQQ